MSKGIGTLSLLLVLAAAAHAQTNIVIKEVLIRGNERITTEAVKANMRSTEGRPLIQADLERDQQSLRILGVFKDVKVFSRALSDTEVQIIVDVAENPVVKEISVSGNTAITTEAILKVVTQQSGQILNLNNRKTTADAIRALYEEKGFFADVDFPPNPDAPETMSVLVIETTVNDVVITGLHKTRRYVVDRLLKTEPGKPFNVKTWASDYRRLATTQWFESVTPTERPTGTIGRFDLLLDVKEQRTALFDVGVALDPRSRLAGTIRVRDQNFRGMGQQIGMNFQQDTFGSGASVSLDYSDPFFDNRDSQIGGSIYSRVNSYFTSFGSGGSNIDPDERFDERRTGANLNFSRGSNDVFATTLGLSYDEIRSVNVSTTNTDFIQQDGRLWKFLLQGVRDRRDVPLDPFSGDYLRFSVEPGLADISKIGGTVAGFTDVLGKNTFVRTTAEYKGFFSKEPKPKPNMTEEEVRKLATKPRDVLATRLRLGTITGTTPFYEQLFIGGADSLRGYAEQRFWGKTAMLGTLEYRKPIQDNFRIIGFVDYGGAWGGYGAINNFSQSDKVKLNLGYGAGLGFTTPLGQIRIDFGFTPDGGSRTHFTIGGSF